TSGISGGFAASRGRAFLAVVIREAVVVTSAQRQTFCATASAHWGVGPPGSRCRCEWQSRSGGRAIPVGAQQCRRALGLDPVRGIEMMALLEHLECEVREDPSCAFSHPPVVIRVASTTERE